jgi:hypothetical protein
MTCFALHQQDDDNETAMKPEGILKKIVAQPFALTDSRGDATT